MGGFSFFIKKKRMAYLSMLDAFWDPKITTMEGSFPFPWEKILRLVEPLSRAARRCGFLAADWRRMVW